MFGRYRRDHDSGDESEDKRRLESLHEQRERSERIEREEVARRREAERRKLEREEEERRRRFADLEWKSRSELAKRLSVLFESKCDYSKQKPARIFVENEGQRFFNAATGECLASPAPDAEGRREIAPDSIRRPGEVGEKSQIWFMMKEAEGSKSDNDYVFSQGEGESVPSRMEVDVEEVFKVKEGPIPVATDDLINGLPPLFPIDPRPAKALPGQTISPITPHTPSSSLTSPPLLSDLQPIVLSAKGSSTSHWLLLDTWDPEYFFIVNAKTSQFLVQDGNTIRTADLKGYRRLLFDWKRQNFTPPTFEELCEKIERKGIDDLLGEEWKRWMWKYEKWDNGPVTDQYRIVHALWPFALEPFNLSHPPETEDLDKISAKFHTHQVGDSTYQVVKELPLSAHSINTSPNNTQVWTVESKALGTDIYYNASNWSQGCNFLNDEFRIIAVPTTAAQTEKLYKIFHPRTRSLLAMDSTKSVVMISAAKYDSEGEESVIRRVYMMDDLNERVWGCVMWRLHQERWGPKDGLYKISQAASKLLTVPRFSPNTLSPIADPTKVYIMDSDAVIPETQWWRITSRITTSGQIYQQVSNHRSGHILNVAIQGTGIGSVNGQRLGTVTETGWILSATSADRNKYTVESFTSSKSYLWGENIANLVEVMDPHQKYYSWGLIPVDTTVTPDKWYFLVNLATNMLLSANGSDSRNKPLLVSSTGIEGQKWQFNKCTDRAHEAQFYTLQSETSHTNGQGVLIAACPQPNGDSISTHGDSLGFITIAGETDKREQDDATWRPVRLDEEMDGYALVNPKGQAIGVSEVGSQEWAVILAPAANASLLSDGQMRFGWRLVEADQNIAAPPSVPQSKQYLPDGMYRITSRQNHLSVSLSQQAYLNRRAASSEAPMRVELTSSDSEEDYFDIWYIQRHRNSAKSFTIKAKEEPEIYTIRSCGAFLFLDIGEFSVRQRFEGVSLWASQYEPACNSEQQWRITKYSAMGWAIETRMIGSILDVSGKTLTTTPLLTIGPTQSQIWNLDPVTPSLSSGAFHIQNIYSTSFLGVKPSTSGSGITPMVVSGRKPFFKPQEQHWRITCQPDGLYHIECLQHLQFLSAIPNDSNGSLEFTNAVDGLRTKWQLWPGIHGSYMVQNYFTKQFLVVKGGHSADGQIIQMKRGAGQRDLPWQLFRLTRIEPLSRSWDDLLTDKVAPAVYLIRNVARNGYLCYPQAPSLYQQAACLRENDTSPMIARSWNIKASGSGYYAIHNTAGYSLGQLWSTQNDTPGSVVALHGFFDAARWKFLYFDSKTCRIVNKDTGLVLTSDSVTLESGASQVLATVDSGPSPNQLWELVKAESPPADVGDDFRLLTREVKYPNGLYNISNIGLTKGSNSSSKLLVATVGNELRIEDKKLHPLSPGIASQVWIISEVESGWYTLRSFLFGNMLCYNSEQTLVMEPNAPSVTDGGFHWKFIQDVVGTNLSLVNRNNLPNNLGVAAEPNEKPQLYQRKNDDENQRWSLVAQTGKGNDILLASGVYTITVYSTPDLTATQGRSALIAEAKERRGEVVRVCSEAIQLIADALTTTLPDVLEDVDMEAVESSVRGSIANEANMNQLLGVAQTMVSLLRQSTLEIHDLTQTTETQREEAIRKRTISVDEAAVAIAEVLVDFSREYPDNKSRGTVSTTAATSTIISTINSIKLLPFQQLATSVESEEALVEAGEEASVSIRLVIREEDLRNALVDITVSMMIKFNSAINTLDVRLQRPTVDPSTSESPTSKVITKNGGNVILSGPLAQSEDRLWHVEMDLLASGDYSISHLTSKQSLAYRPGDDSIFLGEPQDTYYWARYVSRAGGTIFVTKEDKPRILSVNGTSGVLQLQDHDEKDAQGWLMSRAGYYIQNQHNGHTNQVLACASTGGISCVPFTPFSQSRLVDDHRGDSNQIWHLIKDNDGTTRLINEKSRTTLHRNSDGTVQSTIWPPKRTEADAWKLAKNGEHIWFLNILGSKKWLQKVPISFEFFGIGLNASPVIAGDPGNKEDYKGWQFLPVSGIDRVGVLTLPRCLLTGGPISDPTAVYEVRPGNPGGFTSYKQDNSLQRYRILAFGKHVAFMNEATSNILDSSGNSIALESAKNSCWFNLSTDGKGITSIVPGTPAPAFQEVVTATGDLPVNKVLFRVQIGNSIRGDPFVIGSTPDGSIKALPYDPFDKGQLWYQLEWEKGRFITHAESQKLLARSENGQSVQLVDPPFNNRALWTLNTSVARDNGFFGLGFSFALFKLDLTILDNDASLSESKSIGFSTSSTHGCRLVRESPAYTLTWRYAALKTFLPTHGPVLVHSKISLSPISIESFEPSSIANANPKVYVIVRQSSEPIYLNYTDISYCLFYPTKPGTKTGGWRFLTARYNNSTNILESVYFPHHGWIYNVDLTFSIMVNPLDNPLKILKRRLNGSSFPVTKLHVYVDENLSFGPTFPTNEVGKELEDVGKWGLQLDCGKDSVVEVVEAEMMVDDQAGSKPYRPEWVEGKRKWVDLGGGEGEVMPVGILDGM